MINCPLNRGNSNHHLRTLRSGGRRLGARNPHYMDFVGRLCRFLGKVPGVKEVVLAKNCCSVWVTLDNGAPPDTLDRLRGLVDDPPCCGRCDAFEGHLHVRGCQLECCPFCKWQLISCGCAEKLLSKERGLVVGAYQLVLTDEQVAAWVDILNSHGRVPYVHLPMTCVRCGTRDPGFFMADDWVDVVPPVKFPNLTAELRYRILCRACFEWLKHLMPNGWKAATA